MASPLEILRSAYRLLLPRPFRDLLWLLRRGGFFVARWRLFRGFSVNVKDTFARRILEIAFLFASPAGVVGRLALRRDASHAEHLARVLLQKNEYNADAYALLIAAQNRWTGFSFDPTVQEIERAALRLLDHGDLIATIRFFNHLANALRSCGQSEKIVLIAASAQRVGMRLIERGDLSGGQRFFESLVQIFPDVMRPYVLLYGQMLELTKRYRSIAKTATDQLEPRNLIISIVVWGDRYTDLMLKYFIPSLLSPGNVPRLAQMRKIYFEIYTTPNLVPVIKNSRAYQELARLVKIEFIEFAEEIVSGPEYARNSNLRYHVYGGFHHMSIERARALGADLLCIAPDGIHSDGSYSNYVRMIDEGYKAIMFTGSRGQIEALAPILDRMRDEDTQSLSLPPRTLVLLTAKYVHNDFQRFVLTKNNRLVPEVLSLMFFPHAHGFFVRSFHLHPIVIAAEALRKDIIFDYQTVDANLISRMFPDPSEWHSIKVIDDTDDGVMLDLAYAYHPPVVYPERIFEPRQIIDALAHFHMNHLWHFSHRINYHCDETIEEIGTFDFSDDNRLMPKSLHVADAIDMSDQELADYVFRTVGPLPFPLPASEKSESGASQPKIQSATASDQT